MAEHMKGIVKNMKRKKRLAAFLMAFVLAFSLIGCGDSGNNDDGGKKNIGKHNGGTEVEIKYWNAGNGTEWLEALIKAFNEKQSEWYVTYTATAAAEAVLVAFGQKEVDTVDLYITPGAYDTSLMEPLDDILKETADGDSKPLIEKAHAAALDLCRASDGHLYQISTGESVSGIVYSTKVFEKAGIKELPRTTNELLVVCNELVRNDCTPIAHFKAGAYYDRIRTIWQVQYDGYEYYSQNFAQLKDEAGNSPSLEILTKKDGRYEALRVFEQLLTPDNVLPGSNSYDHITVQTMFLNQDIGMMVNGAWLSTEMASTGSVENFKMMKTPVISSITDKLDSVENDMVLRELISAIDLVTDGKAEINDYQSGDGYVVDGKQISAHDWEYVKAARNTVYSESIGGTFIPNYAAEKEGAKEFLKFVCSDAGMKIYSDTLHTPSVFDYSNGEQVDTNDWNSFEMSVLELGQSADQAVADINRSTSHQIFARNLTDDYATYNFIPAFSAKNSADRKTVDEVWETIVDLFNTSFDSWAKAVQ